MDDAAALAHMADRTNERIAAAVAAQAPRLRAFVRRQVADLGEVDDIVQDTFAELVAAYRLMQPIEHVAAWLFRVARNRIVDRFRARSREAAIVERSPPAEAEGASEPERLFEQWLQDGDGGPEADYARELIAEELIAALEELPGAQRDVFIAHEIDGQSFKELAAASGTPINTLLGRKHAAVQHLRRRLQDIYSELER
jgi:RNA polymerase sigma factor (sigma-70 family)